VCLSVSVFVCLCLCVCVATAIAHVGTGEGASPLFVRVLAQGTENVLRSCTAAGVKVCRGAVRGCLPHTLRG
jgi:hypothetical protein